MEDVADGRVHVLHLAVLVAVALEMADLLALLADGVDAVLDVGFGARAPGGAPALLGVGGQEGEGGDEQEGCCLVVVLVVGG